MPENILQKSKKCQDPRENFYFYTFQMSKFNKRGQITSVGVNLFRKINKSPLLFGSREYGFWKLVNEITEMNEIVRNLVRITNSGFYMTCCMTGVCFTFASLACYHFIFILGCQMVVVNGQIFRVIVGRQIFPKPSL